ncbi:MAG: hypothetical protein LBC56_06485 [Oscillospiraceae bacterium]|jgi:hypothetical protein|nr:hypothetical protein [Oscillospiraceae bacterium]
MDYKSMYLRLFNNITDIIYSGSGLDTNVIIKRLEETQRQSEEMYISSDEPNMRVLQLLQENA